MSVELDVEVQSITVKVDDNEMIIKTINFCPILQCSRCVHIAVFVDK